MPRRHFYEFEAIMKRMEEETNDTGRNVIHINTIQRLLRDTPTVEAVPVVHGEWVFVNDIIPYYRCSKCGVKEEYALAKFCRNCGADMRKKV